MTTQENRVNRLPMSLKLMTAGTALSRKLMAEKGTDRPQNRSATRWISRVRPLEASRHQVPGLDKALQVDGHDDRGQHHQGQPPQVVQELGFEVRDSFFMA